MLKKKNKESILICSNDSGGANLIYYWYLKNKKKYNCYFYNSGPAKKIFNKQNISLKKLKKKKFKFVITGTSANSNLEKKIRLFFFKKNMKLIVFIDHYTNYKRRFLYKKKILFPNEIWCSDIYSYRLCKRKFKNQSLIKKVKNYYLDFSKKKIKSFSSQKTKTTRCLYLSEPFSKTINININEISNRLFFFVKKKNIDFLSIKTHPSDEKSNINKIVKNLKRRKINVSINKNSLFKAIGYSDYIVGLRSYAMVVSVNSGKLTYSLLSKKFKKIFLPYKSILKFNFKKFK